MPISEDKKVSQANADASPAHPTTVVTGHEGDEQMGSRSPRATLTHFKKSLAVAGRVDASSQDSGIAIHFDCQSETMQEPPQRHIPRRKITG